MKMWQEFPLAHGKGIDLALSTMGRTTRKGEVRGKFSKSGFSIW